MSDEIQQWAKHSGVASIIEAIANWVRNYRYAVGLRAELAHCGAEEVAHIAHDLGMGPAEFTALAQRGPDAAYQLPRLLRALGVDPKELASVDPGDDACHGAHLHYLRPQGSMRTRSGCWQRGGEQLPRLLPERTVT